MQKQHWKEDCRNFDAQTFEEAFGTMVGYSDSYRYINKLYVNVVVKNAQYSKSTVHHQISLPRF